MPDMMAKYCSVESQILCIKKKGLVATVCILCRLAGKCFSVVFHSRTSACEHPFCSVADGHYRR